MSQTADKRFDPVTAGWMIKIYLDLLADYLLFKKSRVLYWKIWILT